MDQIQERIIFLESRIHQVIQAQEKQNAEILHLIAELKSLKQQLEPTPIPSEEKKPVPSTSLPPFIAPSKPRSSWFNTNEKGMEDLIGRNLINRIGILITVIGVFVGAKYAIDKNLISPAMRIILGYLMSGLLAGVAIYLRKSYKEYSAVMMSGAVTIFYFITYIAWNFYHLFPLLIAFAIMFVATGLAVGMAIWYHNRFIALMGQVGAYALPFLFSTGSGNVMFLFVYMCMVNVGLMILSFLKDWRQIYQIAFYTSWLIFIGANPWQQKQYATVLKMVVLSAQMLIFYGAFLSYKLWRNEAYKVQEVLVLLINAIIYYIIGQAVIKANTTGVTAVTIFALSNAALHFLAGRWLMKRPVQDRSLHLFLIGLGISFLTISIPVALKGNWITILWAIEAVMLGWITYKRSSRVYVVLSTILVLLTLISLAMDWNDVFIQVQSKVWVKPFLNQYFISSFIAVASFGVLAYFYRIPTETTSKFGLLEIARNALPLLFIATGYFTILFELDHVWQSREYDRAFYAFRIPVVLLFTSIYFSIWLYLNWSVFKSREFAMVLFVVSVYVTIYSLIVGLNALGELRGLFLKQHIGEGVAMLGFRYFFMVGLATMVYMTYKSLVVSEFGTIVYRAFMIGVHITLLSILGNEFIHWMDVAGKTGQYALGLSIISGLYALILLCFGIRWSQQYIRISAITGLGLTLLKLLIYDLASLNTISKTAVLIVLGVILLIASFLYTKYKEVISGNGRSVQQGEG